VKTFDSMLAHGTTSGLDVASPSVLAF